MYPSLRELNAEESRSGTSRACCCASDGGSSGPLVHVRLRPKWSPQIVRMQAVQAPDLLGLRHVARALHRGTVSLRKSNLQDRGSEGRGKTVSERDYLAKEETLRGLSEPEGDHELHALRNIRP